MTTRRLNLENCTSVKVILKGEITITLSLKTRFDKLSLDQLSAPN